MEDRHDPMLTYAMTVLAANKQAALPGSAPPSAGSTSTPGAPTASRRGSPGGSTPAPADEAALEALVGEITRLADGARAAGTAPR